MPACPACGQDNPDIAKFCLACGAPLAAPAAPEEERRVVTAVFTDLVGSTSRGEQLDPEDVRAMLVPYYARVRRELEAHGGAVEKFIGDAVVALFGAPVAHEDDPERAVRAALAIRGAIAELNESDPWLDLRIRTAVNTGEALVVLGARTGEGEGMAAGDVMNTAARLQGAAPVNGVVVGEQTYRTTRNVVDYRELEPISAKGKSAPVRVWEVLGFRSATPTAAATRIVGRAAELEKLHALWNDVRDDRRRELATVVGPPGIGKTRLIAELARHAGADGDVFSGRCLSYGEGITYWPITEIVKGATGILQSDDAPTATARLGALLDALPTDDQDELRTMAAALANLLGIATTPRGTYSAEAISQSELHWGVRRVLELLAARRPLLLVVEDVHWAEPTLLDLLSFIAEGTAPTALLIVASGRPELLDSAHPIASPARAPRSLVLDALDDDASRALLVELAERPLPPALVDAVLRNAAGNPLFLEEMVRMLVDDESLEKRMTAADLEALPVPANVQALIASRLDRLPTFARRVAQHAAVGGNVFWSGAVATLVGGNGEVEQALAELERRDFVRSHETTSVAGESEYAFKHALIRDVAYARVPKGHRVELHARFADWVADLPGPEDEFVEIVAYHLEQSCRLAGEIARSPLEPPVEQAADALRRSAEKSKRREGTREAHRFYTRALELVGDDLAELRAELTLGRARLTDALGELRGAYDAYSSVAEEALRLGRPDLRSAALLALANVDQRQGRATDARRRVDEAGAIASEVGDRALEVRTIFESANLRSWFEGAVEDAEEELRRALELTDAETGPLRVEAYMRLGTLLFNAGRFADAEQALVEAATIAGADGSFRDETRVMSILAYVKYFRDVEEAERLAMQAVERFERTSDSYLQAQNLRLLAKCALARADAALAEERLTEALPLALEGGGWVVIEIYRYLAEALVAQGRLDDARELVAFAARNVPEEDPYARAAALLAEAIVAAADGEHVAASATFSEVLTLLEQQQLAFDLAEARIVFASALRKLGETVGARTELERARNAFVRMGADATVAQIDRELSELRAGAGASGPRT